MIRNNNVVEIYIDGACSGNPGPGGWGAYFKYKEFRKKLYGSEKDTTNNRMEIKAAIEGLKALKQPSKVIIYTDSIYLKNGMTLWISKWIVQNFKKNTRNPIKNIDLWESLVGLTKMHEIEWRWIKGHSNNEGNNIADYLARKGRDDAKMDVY